MARPPLSEIVSIVAQARVPTIIWGDPGVGKTRIVEATFRLLNGFERPKWGEKKKFTGLITMIGSTLDPTDIGGMPFKKEGDLGYVREAGQFVYKLNEAAESGEFKALGWFLDEFSNTPPAVQAPLLRAIQDGEVGDEPLHPAIARIAAANPQETAANGFNLTAPMANRFCHIDHSADRRAWISGMVQGFPDPPVIALPEGWYDKYIQRARNLIAGFNEFKPTMHYMLPEDETGRGKPWPSHRSWDELAAPLIAATMALEAQGLPDDKLGALRTDLVAGCVGLGVAQEFLNWMKDSDLPDPEWLLDNPERFEVPSRGDQVFTVLNSVVIVAIDRMTEFKGKERAKKAWDNAWDILAVAAKTRSADIAASAAMMLVNKRGDGLTLPPNVTSTREFIPILQAAKLMR